MEARISSYSKRETGLLIQLSTIERKKEECENQLSSALEALLEVLNHSPRSMKRNWNGETEQDSPYHRSLFYGKHR